LLVLLSVSALGLGNGAKATDFGSLAVSGYVHVRWSSDFRTAVYPRHSFELSRMRLRFRYIPSDIGANIELGCDELVPAIQDAYVQYRLSPALGFVAGLKKMPFSLEELTPAGKLLVIERGLTNDRFGDYAYLGRDIGLTAEGELFGPKLPVAYALGVYNGNQARLSRDYNNAKQFAERLTVSPVAGLTIGVSGAQRNDSLTGLLVRAYGADFACSFGRLTVQAEVLEGNAGPDEHMAGAWVAAAYRLGAFEPAARVERLYPDLAATGAHEAEVTLACNWYLHRRLQVKVNLVGDENARGQYEPRILAQAQVSF
jgi:hypothetical protein